jgi:hypothetical protein
LYYFFHVPLTLLHTITRSWCCRFGTPCIFSKNITVGIEKLITKQYKHKKEPGVSAYFKVGIGKIKRCLNSSALYPLLLFYYPVIFFLLFFRLMLYQRIHQIWPFGGIFLIYINVLEDFNARSSSKQKCISCRRSQMLQAAFNWQQPHFSCSATEYTGNWKFYLSIE